MPTPPPPYTKKTAAANNMALVENEEVSNANSGNNENNNRSATGFELTQDCIAWDESDNVDLRILARSPHMPSTPSLLTTPKSKSSGSRMPHAASIATLDSLKRKLHQTTAATTDNNYSNKKHNNRSRISNENDDKNNNNNDSSPSVPCVKMNPENEIDGILQLLERQDSNASTSSSLSSPTTASRYNNQNKHLVRSASYPPSNRAATTTTTTTNQPNFRRDRKRLATHVESNNLACRPPVAAKQTKSTVAPKGGRSERHRMPHASNRPSSTHSLPSSFPNHSNPVSSFNDAATSHNNNHTVPFDFESLLQQLDGPPKGKEGTNGGSRVGATPKRPPFQTIPNRPPPSQQRRESSPDRNQAQKSKATAVTKENFPPPPTTTTAVVAPASAAFSQRRLQPSQPTISKLSQTKVASRSSYANQMPPPKIKDESTNHTCHNNYSMPPPNRTDTLTNASHSQRPTTSPFEKQQPSPDIKQRQMTIPFLSRTIPHAINTNLLLDKQAASFTQKQTQICVGPSLMTTPRMNVQSHIMEPSNALQYAPTITTPGQHPLALEPQDEFGSIDFSADDWDNLDSLILAATQQPEKQDVSQHGTTNPTPGAGAPTANKSLMLSPQPQQQSLLSLQQVPQMQQHQQQLSTAEFNVPRPTQSSSINPNTIPSMDDLFDDFPQMDFDALDQKIAACSYADQTMSSPEASAPSNPIGSYILPPLNAAVRNRRVATPSDSNLTFLTFSRYTVLTVECDTVTYTKTLVVSTWDSTTSYDEKFSKWLHRSELLEQAVGAVQTRHGWVPQKVLEGSAAGCIHLRGEWYHTSVDRGDTIHLCSLEGMYRTDVAALPILLHTCPPQGSDPDDDLLLVIHPDEFLFPSIISEGVTCSRRAVLRARLGSSGISAKTPLLGTLRHELFERCIENQDFSATFAKDVIHKIVTKNAEALMGCGINRLEAEEEIIRVLPQFQTFANEYTSFAGSNQFKENPPMNIIEGIGFNPPIRFIANRVLAAEETIVSPELGVKGSIDVLVQATTEVVPSGMTQHQHQHLAHSKTTSRMSIELKTGFKQTNNNTHAAQLAFYAMMLRARYGSQKSQSPGSPACSSDIGAADGGMLLYVNHESLRTQHVSPMINEIKSLIGQRNLVVSELLRASSPRGLVLEYENGENGVRVLSPKLLPAPPAPLPEMLPLSNLCKLCYAKRECTMYAAAESEYQGSSSDSAIVQSHGPLLQQYTGHLDKRDIEYFLQWDRLIDFEIDACSTSSAAAWLVSSTQREKSTGQCLSSLVLSEPSISSLDPSESTLVFKRSIDSLSQTALENLDLEPGCYVIVSTDASLMDISKCQAIDAMTQSRTKRFRHQLYLVRGTLVKVDSVSIVIRASHTDAERARTVVRQSQEMGHNVRFRLDKDLATFGTGTLRQNLINLFTKEGEPPDAALGKDAVRYDRRLPWLRDMVVRLLPPQFEEGVKASIFNSSYTSSKPIPGCEMMELAFEFSELNPDQQAAVEKAVAAKDYTLIQGLPGTGKTSTIAFVARLLAAHGKRVLITSYTHAAVDNVLLKLMANGLGSSGDRSLVRVGTKSSCHCTVQSILATSIATKLASGCHFTVPTLSAEDEEPVSPDDLANVMATARIVGVTALTIPRSALLINQHFDVVIVDEAGQISQPAVLGALMAADSFILVGDHLQLPPLVQSELAEKGGYGVSMLKRLADSNPTAIAQLTLQYRMHEDVCQLSNELVYGGKLKCANDQVRRQMLALKHFPKALPQPLFSTLTAWLVHVIDPQRPVVFVDTDRIRISENKGSSELMDELEGNAARQRGGNIVNETEATIVHHIVQGFVSTGLETTSIGIVTPFRAQIRVLEESGRIRQWKSAGLEVSTIDRYQGRDKRAIIISFVRSNVKGRVGRLLSDPRRLNVAMTRAKCKLIMVGSFSTLHKGSDMLRPVLDSIRARSQMVELPDNALKCYNII